MEMDRGVSPKKPHLSADDDGKEPPTVIQQEPPTSTSIQSDIDRNDSNVTKEDTTSGSKDHIHVESNSAPVSLDVPASMNAERATIDPVEANNCKNNQIAPKASDSEATADKAKKMVAPGQGYAQGVIKALQKENEALKEKIGKLRNLLARSAAASKTVSVELNASKAKVDNLSATVSRLTARCESLANRPTHLDLLANFEARFDAALLSIDKTSDGQPGGEDSYDNPNTLHSQPHGHVEDFEQREALYNELSESKQKLESLLQHAAKLEESNEKLLTEREEIDQELLKLKDEIRTRKFEERNLKKELKEKSYELMEMQMEIDLVTKSSLDANTRATEVIESTKLARASEEYTRQLELKVAAMEEWALASASAKQIAVDRCSELESKLRALYYEDHLQPMSSLASRVLLKETSSLVVGAGMKAEHVVRLDGSEQSSNFDVTLRFKLDISPKDSDIVFSVFKGEGKKQTKDFAVIHNRRIYGGGAGEADNAFEDNTCTIVFCNSHSWIRPRIVKLSIEAITM